MSLVVGLSALVALDVRPATTGAIQAKAQAVDGDLDYFTRLGTLSADKRDDEFKKAKWSAGITDAERRDIRDYFELQQTDLTFYGTAPVLKADLDGDGAPEFIMVVVFRQPTPSRFGAPVCVLTRREDGIQLRFITPPFTYSTTARTVSVVDVDGDGLKDVVDEPEVELYGEDPPIYPRVFRIRNMVDATTVYEGEVFDHLRFQDLDGDGRQELLEPVIGTPRSFPLAPPPVLWINVFAWDGSRLVKQNARFPQFYREKQREYERALSLLQSQRGKRRPPEADPSEAIQDRAFSDIYRDYVQMAKRLGAGSK